MEDAFEVLGLSRGATEEEIRAAHRQLARRWHPDRFSPGPERAWAEDKMIRINGAYMTCLNGIEKNGRKCEYPDVRRLIKDGHYREAKEILMKQSLRSGEWNCLFGRALLGMGDREKARLYLSVAHKQDPENEEVRKILAELGEKEENNAAKLHGALKHAGMLLTKKIIGDKNRR